MRNPQRLSADHLVTRRSERGATATEYGLLVGFIAMAIVAGVTVFGLALNDAYAAFAQTLGKVLGQN